MHSLNGTNWSSCSSSLMTVRLPGVVDDSSKSMQMDVSEFHDIAAVEEKLHALDNRTRAKSLEGDSTFCVRDTSSHQRARSFEDPPLLLENVLDRSGKSTKSHESSKPRFSSFAMMLKKKDKESGSSSSNSTKITTKARRWSLFAGNDSTSEIFHPVPERTRSHSFSGSGHGDAFHFDPAQPRDGDPVEFSDREVNNICSIGEGGTCVVHRVICQGRQMAAKAVKSSIVGDKELRASEDLIREVAILSRLSAHPNVIKLYGVVRRPRLKLLMEYVEGESLADFLWDKERRHGYGGWKPSKQQALAWGLGMMRGLAFLHHQRPVVMHRDLKPANLMLLEDGWNVKIIDFGLSRPLVKMAERPPSEGPVARALFGRQLTMATGTFRYMAAEVWAGEDYSEKADVYSAALILWELAAGQKAFFEQEDDLKVPAKRCTLRPPLKLVSIPALQPILADAWHADPALRADSATVVRRLEKIGAVIPSGKSSHGHGRDKCVVQ